MTNFNHKHPELREGEIWLSNVLKEYNSSRRTKCYDDFTYKSKRLGKQAYDIHGNLIEEASPVFISKAEHQERVKKYSK